MDHSNAHFAFFMASTRQLFVKLCWVYFWGKQTFSGQCMICGENLHAQSWAITHHSTARRPANCQVAALSGAASMKTGNKWLYTCRLEKGTQLCLGLRSAYKRAWKCSYKHTGPMGLTLTAFTATEPGMDVQVGCLQPSSPCERSRGRR